MHHISLCFFHIKHYDLYTYTTNINAIQSINKFRTIYKFIIKTTTNSWVHNTQRNPFLLGITNIKYAALPSRHLKKH